MPPPYSGKCVNNSVCYVLNAVSYLVQMSTLKMEATVPPERQLIFNGLHGVTSQKTELFITRAVCSSNPT
jgi:hypothetical protein